MLEALRARRVEKLPAQVVLKGRILFLTEDAGLVRRQLDGEDLNWRPGTALRDNIFYAVLTMRIGGQLQEVDERRDHACPLCWRACLRHVRNA